MDIAVQANAGGASQSITLPFQKNIHYLRGIAALGVLLTHAGIYYQLAYNSDAYRPYFPDVIANYGVGIFFAISGFLMRELVVKQDCFTFLSRRLLRIYPTFLIATILAVLVIPTGFRTTYSLFDATLIPMRITAYPLLVEWTLVHEVFFYVVLFVVSLIGARSLINPIAIIWTGLIILNAAFNDKVPRIGHASLTEVAFMMANVGFTVGLLVPWIAERVKAPVLMLILFCLSVVIYHWVPINFTRICVGFGSAALLCAAIQSNFIMIDFIDKCLGKMGDWSYALYLIHVPVVTLIFRNFEGHSYVYPIGILFAVLASFVLGEIDLSLHERLKRWATNAPSTVIKWSIAAYVLSYFAIALYLQLLL